MPDLNVTAYMGDFDSAMRSAVALEFPGIHVYGCFFHYAQCLVKKAGKVGLAGEIRRRGSDVRKAFLALTALPLLPAGEIEPAFHFYSLRAIDIDANFSGLLSYMRTFWLERIGPEAFSVYRAPCNTRTNNAVESHNATLLRAVKAKVHCPIWDLIGEFLFVAPKMSLALRSLTLCMFNLSSALLFPEELVKDEQDTYTDYLSAVALQMTNIRSVPTANTESNHRIINEAWDLFDAGHISAIDLLWRVKYRTGAGNSFPFRSVFDKAAGAKYALNNSLSGHCSLDLIGICSYLQPTSEFQKPTISKELF